MFSGCNLWVATFLLLLGAYLCGQASSDSLMMCPVPLPCHCIGDETIYCAFKRMKDLPYFLEFNAVWNTMNLSDNLLPDLPGNKFVGGRIRHLDLSRNIINKVNIEAFVGLSDLEVLDMSYNYLSEVPGQALSSLVDLRSLLLKYNRFSWVSATTFAGITQLEQLDLSGNDLTAVPTSALRPLGRLKVLKLRNNKIKQIHGYAFEGLPLETLDLGDNESPITLDSRAFCGQEPKVSHEERNVMEWDGMYTLFLDHNGLSFIDPCIAKLVWTLTTFDVSGNPLRCDCRLYMFRNWGTRTKFPRAQCDSPVKFAGEMVDKLDQSRFNCSHREQYARCDNLCQSVTPTPNSGAAGGHIQTAGGSRCTHIIVLLILATTWWWATHYVLIARRVTHTLTMSCSHDTPIHSS